MTEPTADAPPETSDAEQLKTQLAEAERKAAENWDKFLRASAELENVRRRVERESATLHKYALERILGELIVVNDSLELGMKAAAGDEKAVEGLQLIQKQFWTVLERHGVSVVDPAGEPFNPDLHQAVSTMESADAKPGHVLSVMQKGYRLHERLLRPAMVVVAKATTTGSGGQGTGDGEKPRKSE